ncbi:TIR domain-containing protein [Prolixibacter sp. SD074]|uniref:TIR domain-containing protein n=1 Tax=Prolixibacter sp. SD074 TaxID=2652391 RepID=UPI0012706AD7|nr:nucleotide-binding protein [Prolixibacter sp. SD074]GET29419.1 hypothetical protein SD074_16210 [Prolixibacter sp. SD074]
MEYSNKIELLEGLKNFVSNYQEQDKPDVIKRHVTMVVEKIMGNDKYKSEIAQIKFVPSMVAHNVPGFEDASITYRRIFNQGKQEMVSLIQTILKDIEIDNQIDSSVKENLLHTTDIDLNRIFIVHGHNNEIKLDVARTLEKLDLEPIILHEKPNLGRTLINKFTDYSNVDFAIVIISADDYGYSKKDGESNKKLRPRQNVVFELGYFIAKLGIEKVFPLIENEKIEDPGDFDGVVYVPYNSGWKNQLVLELKSLGYKIDANKLYE